MARSRVALTEKEERILVQSQLMGLTPASMVKIGNRLKALEKERQDIAEISQAVGQKTWIKTASGWDIKLEDGLLVSCVRKSKETHWNVYSIMWDVKVTKPGTRFKPRHYKDKKLYVNYDWRAKICPGSSKELYSLIKWTNNIKWEMVTV